MGSLHLYPHPASSWHPKGLRITFDYQIASDGLWLSWSVLCDEPMDLPLLSSLSCGGSSCSDLKHNPPASMKEVWHGKLDPTQRTDNLWQTTCFELFILPKQPQAFLYDEWNIAPSGQWAWYRFHGIREPLPHPACGSSMPSMWFWTDKGAIKTWLHLPFDVLPKVPYRLGATMVLAPQDKRIERGYAAMQHSQPHPNFHQPNDWLVMIDY